MRTLEPEDFENAVKVLDRLGWCKGSAVGPGGAVCAARALNIAAKERSGDYCDLFEARKFLNIDDPGLAGIARWNDRPSTGFLDIQAEFVSAARRMRQARELEGVP